MNGKYEGLNLIFDFLPNNFLAKYKRVCFSSAKETSLSIYKPSIWWNKQWALEETASFLYTLPGEIVLIGGLFFCIYLACTDDVWVLKRRSGLVWIKKVSCISLAGWFFGTFNAVKLCQSSSISGPSEIENPIDEKISTISCSTIDKGCLEPILLVATGFVRSSRLTCFSVVIVLYVFIVFSLTSALSSLSICPTSFFSWFGIFLNSLKRELSIPDFPKNFNLKTSISSFVFRDVFFASCMISEILFNTLILFYVYLFVYRTQRNNFYAKYKF